jgi:bifunctional non-homologous end joining protein LigD
MAFQRKNPEAIGVKARFPGFVAPALATSIERVPKGGRWIHEINFDGYRVQLHLSNDDIKVFTRRGNDWTKRFKKIAGDAYLINAGSAIIDGEVVVPAANGSTDISVCCKTNSRGNRPRSQWSLSICSISTYTICESCH